MKNQNKNWDDVYRTPEKKKLDYKSSTPCQRLKALIKCSFEKMNFKKFNLEKFLLYSTIFLMASICAISHRVNFDLVQENQMIAINYQMKEHCQGKILKFIKTTKKECLDTCVDFGFSHSKEKLNDVICIKNELRYSYKSLSCVCHDGNKQTPTDISKYIF